MSMNPNSTYDFNPHASDPVIVNDWKLTLADVRPFLKHGWRDSRWEKLVTFFKRKFRQFSMWRRGI